MVYDLQMIVKLLKGRKIGFIADKTGISRATISGIVNGRNANPTYSVVKTLSDYFKQENINNGRLN